MFYDRSLSKLRVFKLDKCISHHNFVKYGTKKAKLEAIKVNVIQQLSRRIEEEEHWESEKESNSESEEDCVLAEIGDSSSEEEEESEEEETALESTGNFNVNTSVV